MAMGLLPPIWRLFAVDCRKSSLYSIYISNGIDPLRQGQSAHSAAGVAVWGESCIEAAAALLDAMLSTAPFNAGSIRDITEAEEKRFAGHREGRVDFSSLAENSARGSRPLDCSARGQAVATRGDPAHS